MRDSNQSEFMMQSRIWRMFIADPAYYYGGVLPVLEVAKATFNTG